MAKNEIVVASKFNLVTIDADLAEAVAEEMDGLGSLSFDRVKIPSGGGLAFELPGENEDDTETAPQIDCVILDHHPVNAYWADQYAGGNEQPDCSSIDGKQGVDRTTGEIKSCENCQFNKFGSDKNGTGKACKNVHRLYLLREGSPVPVLLALPPTSLKSMRDYVGKKILLKGMRCHQALTRITLKKEKNAGGITYSRAVFTFMDKLTPEQQKQAEAMRTMVQATRRNIDIDEEDYSMGSPAGSGAPAPRVDESGFMQVPEGAGENLPFN